MKCTFSLYVFAKIESSACQSHLVTPSDLAHIFCTVVLCVLAHNKYLVLRFYVSLAVSSKKNFGFMSRVSAYVNTLHCVQWAPPRTDVKKPGFKTVLAGRDRTNEIWTDPRRST